MSSVMDEINRIAEGQDEPVIADKDFTPRKYTRALLDRYEMFYDKYQRLYVYDDVSGLWIEGAENLIRAELRKNMLEEKMMKTYYVKEILADLKEYLFDPNHPDFPAAQPTLIPFNNGVYDMETGKFGIYKSEHHFIRKLVVEYDPYAKCPTIDKVFGDITENPEDLFELIGYCFWRGYNYQKIFFLLGDGGNGKSVFANILVRVLGKDNVSAVGLEELQDDKFSVAELYEKMANIGSEASYTKNNATEMIKKLTGGDLFRAQQKYEKPFTFRNYAKLIILVNEMPKTTDITPAFFERLMILKFPNKIRGTDKENKNLLNEISDREFYGLAYRALQSLIKIRERGFTFTNNVDGGELRKEYERLTDPISEFLKKFTVDDPDTYVPKKDFIKAFQEWQRNERYRIWTTVAIGKRMKELGYETGRRTIDFTTTNLHLEGGEEEKVYIRCWLGLDWVE